MLYRYDEVVELSQINSLPQEPPGEGEDHTPHVYDTVGMGDDVIYSNTGAVTSSDDADSSGIEYTQCAAYYYGVHQQSSS